MPYPSPRASLSSPAFCRSQKAAQPNSARSAKSGAAKQRHSQTARIAQKAAQPVILLFLSLLFLQGCAKPPTGKITIYSDRSEALIGPLVEKYKLKTHLDVEVRYPDQSSPPTAADLADCDVFLSRDIGTIAALDEAGLLAPVGPSTFQSVPLQHRAESGHYVGIAGRLRVLCYNTRQLKEVELPTNIQHLTHPDWSGRIGWAPATDSFQHFITALRRIQGDESTTTWLQDIQANAPNVYPDNLSIVAACASGEIDIGFVNHNDLYIANANSDKALPVANHFLPGGPGAFLNLACAGILQHSGLKQESEIFLGYLVDDNTQSYFADEVFEFPVKPKVKAHEDLPKQEDLRFPDITFTDLDDREGSRQLLKQTKVLH